MQQKNLNNIINAALAIEAQEAKEAGALGYMARALVQATLPHSKINGNEFKRRNGAFKLTILADSEVGLPYGSIPRLLIAWITTEAVRTKKREIILGHTLSEFMRELDLVPTGGRWGSITRLRQQMQKLFSAAISCTYDDGNHWAIKSVQPVSYADLWWDPKHPTQSSLFKSTVLLGEEFFKESIEKPVPIDMRVLKGLRRSPMALDIYCWLTYRMSYLRKKTCIPWESLYAQFGANYKFVRQFKASFLEHIKAVNLLYPCKVDFHENGLMIYPSKSHVSSVDKAVI